MREYLLASLCLWAGLAAAGAGLSVAPQPAPSIVASNDIRRDAAVVAIERVMPSVVNIATETVIEYQDWYEDLFRRFYGMPNARPRQQRNVSLGSGVIIDEEGYILTNFHVVRRATRVQVKLWDGREYDAEPQVATEGSDVALIKIKAKPGEKFAAAKFAVDDDLLLGETVLALGNPFGLGGSVTKGILSSKNRRPSTGNEPLNVEDWLQTDAAINPGNSGGPLVNLKGEIIGLNVAVYRDQEGARGMGVGFSIPIRQVGIALSQFFTPEVTDSLWLGARFIAGRDNIRCVSVVPGSPAEKAGLAQGDQVVRLNGVVASNLVSLNNLFVSSPQNQAKLTYRRGKETRAAEIRMLPFSELNRIKLGLNLLESTSPEAKSAGVPPGSGLLVKAVETGSPTDKAGLEPGMIVSGINREAIKDLRHFGERLARVKPGDNVVLSVIVTRRLGRQIARQEVAVEIETR